MTTGITLVQARRNNCFSLGLWALAPQHAWTHPDLSALSSNEEVRQGVLPLFTCRLHVSTCQTKHSSCVPVMPLPTAVVCTCKSEAQSPRQPMSYPDGQEHRGGRPDFPEGPALAVLAFRSGWSTTAGVSSMWLSFLSAALQSSGRHRLAWEGLGQVS